MAAPIRTPRSTWVDAALEVLATEGVDAVRIETLATRLGVTKGGFYGHFKNREALLGAMLDAWERRAVTDVLVQVADIVDPAERMRQAGHLTFADDVIHIDLAVRQWARRDLVVAARLGTVDNERMGLLRRLFATFVDDPDEVEARSTLAFAAAIGTTLMAVDHGEYSRDGATRLAADFVLRRPG